MHRCTDFTAAIHVQAAGISGVGTAAAGDMEMVSGAGSFMLLMLLSWATGFAEWLVPQMEWHKLKYGYSNYLLPLLLL